MKAAGMYSFNGGREEVMAHHPDLMAEVSRAIASAVDPARLETNTPDRPRFGTAAVTAALRGAFAGVGGWHPVRVTCTYPPDYYVEGYEIRPTGREAFRELDFVKRRLGVGLLFGK